MSNHIDKANEYAIDVLKMIITISSGTLVLTITFLKNIVGNSAPQFPLLLLFGGVFLFFGWIFLLFSIILSWFSLADAANKFPNNGEMDFIFKSEP